MKQTVALIHWHEVSLKGENRPLFERTLMGSVFRALEGFTEGRPRIIMGRGVVPLAREADEFEVAQRLKKVFGIANFAVASRVKADLDGIAGEAFFLLCQKTFSTFRIAARRAEKSFPLTSQEVNERLGKMVQDEFGKAVDLDEPDVTCFVEIVGKDAFVYVEKHKGYGGLPVGVSGSVCALVSSGFDSPIASWMMMRRGCRVTFVHFHSYPSTSRASQENVKELVKLLAGWQDGAVLFFVSLLDIQKAIAVSADPSLRVVLYRRFMVRIAERIAHREKCQALVTGDSLGQVASQTLENIAVVSEAAALPVLRPLIGENKERIIAWAKELGTFDLSSQPYDDCCSLFTPEHPETKANLLAVEEAEANLPAADLVAQAVEKAELVRI